MIRKIGLIFLRRSLSPCGETALMRRRPQMALCPFFWTDFPSAKSQIMAASDTVNQTLAMRSAKTRSTKSRTQRKPSPNIRGSWIRHRYAPVRVLRAGEAHFCVITHFCLLLSKSVKSKIARSHTGRGKPMQERAHYSFWERMLLSGGRIFTVFARMLSASRRLSLYGSRTEIQRLGTR